MLAFFGGFFLGFIVSGHVAAGLWKDWWRKLQWILLDILSKIEKEPSNIKRAEMLIILKKLIARNGES